MASLAETFAGASHDFRVGDELRPGCFAKARSPRAWFAVKPGGPEVTDSRW
jgi:hypothetical protein